MSIKNTQRFILSSSNVDVKTLGAELTVGGFPSPDRANTTNNVTPSCYLHISLYKLYIPLEKHTAP